MTTQNIAEVISGDTSDIWELGFVTSAPGARPVVLAELDASFSLTIKVLGAGTPAERVITAKNAANTRFLACLLPSETEALAPGEYTVDLKLSNPTLSPALVKTLRRKIKIWPR